MMPAWPALCMKSPTMRSALCPPWPKAAPRSVTRWSLKPTQAPATTLGRIAMNQPSAPFCVVPVLPATSPRTPKRVRSIVPVPLSTASRIMSTSTIAGFSSITRCGWPSKRASSWPSRSVMWLIISGSRRTPRDAMVA